MKKRRQHYVWRAYLAAWATDELIWCSRLGGEPYQTNLTNVAQSRDFYKPQELNQADIAMIQAIAIDGTPPALQKLNRPWIELFGSLSLVQRKMRENGSTDSEAARFISDSIHNFEEDLHQRVEELGSKCLEALRRGDTSLLRNDSEVAKFIQFLSTQYMRTKKVKETSIAAVGARFPAVDLEKIWSVLSHIFSTSVGLNLFLERKQSNFFLLQCPKGLEFITGDQPVINIQAAGSRSKPPDDVELYYPISPRTALLITKRWQDRDSDLVELSESQAILYNAMMADEAHEQMFSSNREMLLAVMSYRHQWVKI